MRGGIGGGGGVVDQSGACSPVFRKCSVGTTSARCGVLLIPPPPARCCFCLSVKVLLLVFQAVCFFFLPVGSEEVGVRACERAPRVVCLGIISCIIGCLSSYLRARRFCVPYPIVGRRTQLFLVYVVSPSLCVQINKCEMVMVGGEGVRAG